MFFVTCIIFRLTNMQMHNKMEIEGAASDTVRPSATDLRREAGQMRGFHSQSCRFGGENAAEAAEAQRYVNRKEVRDRRNEKMETIRGRARPGAWHGLNCTSRCRSTASCWPCATLRLPKQAVHDALETYEFAAAADGEDYVLSYRERAT